MEQNVLGIHHVTAITGDPQPNLDFYAGILGLRFVKKTVNFDAPDTYHFYYGDEVGHPGTILTFFSWPGYRGGRRGNGQVTTTAFIVPAASFAYWRERLASYNVQIEEQVERFGEQVLAFTDHEGLGLALVAQPGAEQISGWSGGPVPAEHAIRGFHSVTLSVSRYDATVALLTRGMGFQEVGKEGNRTRFLAPAEGEGIARIVDVLNLPAGQRGIESVGTVHHVAWRTANDDEQLLWRARMSELGMQVTPVLDRTYFHSIYFREPSGILFEIATDQPGFPVDEPVSELGTHLKLPPWLESHRPEIEQSLQPVAPRTVKPSEQVAPAAQYEEEQIK